MIGNILRGPAETVERPHIFVLHRRRAPYDHEHFFAGLLIFFTLIHFCVAIKGEHRMGVNWMVVLRCREGRELWKQGYSALTSCHISSINSKSYFVKLIEKLSGLPMSCKIYASLLLRNRQKESGASLGRVEKFERDRWI